ncbi:hypothetical protein [Marinimicrobium alkaliphilum]|uniref:hypothetical protein n=1 Tax=Marinimicrobium alkaliphilum TaxID=2202654 RepID=UPI00130065A0|nr:hypothetical protein [Marinimicrobium alkaliphilum]
MLTSTFVRMAAVAVLLAVLSGLLLYPERGADPVIGYFASSEAPRGGDAAAIWPTVRDVRDAPAALSGSASSAPASYQSSTRAPAAYPGSHPLEQLHAALSLGFSRAELRAFAAEIDTDVLNRFFARHSHIDRDWLHRQGLDASLLSELYALWGAGAGLEALAEASEPAYISRFSAERDGGTLRLQDSFRQTDRTLYLRYSVPEDYSADSVLIRWSDDQGQLRHFDWHGLTESPGLLQEAWYRPAEDWAPGHYQVEVYSVGERPRLLGGADYRVH